MSKMKEISQIEDYLVDILDEHLEYNVQWSILDDNSILNELDGNDFANAIHHIRQNVVYKLNTKYNG